MIEKEKMIMKLLRMICYTIYRQFKRKDNYPVGYVLLCGQRASYMVSCVKGSSKRSTAQHVMPVGI